MGLSHEKVFLQSKISPFFWLNFPFSHLLTRLIPFVQFSFSRYFLFLILPSLTGFVLSFFQHVSLDDPPQILCSQSSGQVHSQRRVPRVLPRDRAGRAGSLNLVLTPAHLEIS